MPDEYAGWDQMFSPAKRALDYEGLSREEAEALAGSNGVQAIRVADPDHDAGTAFLADYRPGRLNLLVHQGRVVRAAFG